MPRGILFHTLITLIQSIRNNTLSALVPKLHWERTGLRSGTSETPPSAPIFLPQNSPSADSETVPARGLPKCNLGNEREARRKRDGSARWQCEAAL